MIDGIAIGACSVAAIWICFEATRRWLKERADARWFADIRESVPREVWHSKRGVLTDDEELKVARVFGVQDTTLPKARVRKSTRKK